MEGHVSRIEAPPILSSKGSALMLPLQGKGRQWGEREEERRSWTRRLKAQVEDEDDVWPAMILTSINRL